MTSPRAARLAAGLAAAVVVVVVLLLPGRHAALAAPNDYATDSFPAPGGDRSPLPAANADAFDPWDRAAGHRGRLPFNPYAQLPATDTDRSDRPLPEADFMKDRMQEATDLTVFINDRVEAETELARASMVDAAWSIANAKQSRAQTELLKDLLSTLVGVAKNADEAYGVELFTSMEYGRLNEYGRVELKRPPRGSDNWTVAKWIMDFASVLCDDVRWFLNGYWRRRPGSFGKSDVRHSYLNYKDVFEYDKRHRNYLKALKIMVDAVEIMAIEFLQQSREQKQSVKYEAYKNHFRELDTFLEKAGSLDNVLKTPYMDIDGSLSSSEMWFARENLLAIELDNDIQIVAEEV